MARIDDLRELRAGLVERMSSCDSDQNYAVMGRLLADVVKQIEELDPAVAGPAKETGLSEFEKALRTREARTKGSARTRSG